MLFNLFKKNKKPTVLLLTMCLMAFLLFLAAKTNAQVCDVIGTKCTLSDGKDGGCAMSSSGTLLCSPLDPTGKAVPINEAAEVQKQIDAESSGGLWDWLGNIAFKVIFKFIDGVMYIFFFIVGQLFALAGALLDFVLTKPELQKFTQAPVVRAGWVITRDLANMFFALIMLIIAFATILRIESYGYKQILPKLIIAALLINFSLVISGVIIDFSQVLTKYFVDAALSGSNGQSLSATIANKLSVAKGVIANADQAKTIKLSESLDGLAASAIGLFAGIITILIAAFVFFAAALLFIVRYIALLFLLILAPLAWFFYIIPATRRYWDQWWSTFFKWAFFAPAFAFFLYLSMLIIKSGVMNQVGVNTGAATGSSFGRFSIPVLINFIIIMGFLIGSILVAQKMGIWGAGAIISAGKSAGRGVARFTGRKAGYDRYAPRITSAAGKAIGAIGSNRLMAALGVKKIGGIVQGKALQMREKQLERPENKAYSRYLNSLAPEQVANELKSARGVNALLATRAAKDSKILENADPETARRAMANFRAFGQIKEARELEETRPDAIDTSTDAGKVAQDEAIQRAIASGTYKKWGSRVFAPESGKDIIEKLRTQVPPGDFISAFKGWSKQVQESAKSAMQDNFKTDDNFDNKDNMDRRKIYASATGNIGDAFKDSSGNINDGAAADHIQRMAPVHVGSVNKDEDLQLIGRHISTGVLSQIRGELSAQQKKQIKQGIERGANDETKRFINNSPAWNV